MYWRYIAYVSAVVGTCFGLAGGCLRDVLFAVAPVLT